MSSRLLLIIFTKIAMPFGKVSEDGWHGSVERHDSMYEGPLLEVIVAAAAMK